MKKLILFLLACSVGLAQSVSVRRNFTTNGALLGAVAGAVIGNNSGNHNGAQGALIGAAAGAILGNVAADAQRAPSTRSYQRGPQHRAGDPVIGGAVLGGVTGAIIGNNSGHGNGARGALIGAAAGAILGGPGHHRQPRAQPYYGYGYGRGYGYGYGYGRGAGYTAYPNGSYRTYENYRSYDRGDAVGAGMFFGGIAGAIIGNNSGHGYGNGAKGAVIGIAAGALLGALSEPPSRTYDERPRHYPAPRTNYVQQMQAQPQQVTVINNYYVNVAPASGGYKTDAPAY